VIAEIDLSTLVAYQVDRFADATFNGITYDSDNDKVVLVGRSIGTGAMMMQMDTDLVSNIISDNTTEPSRYNKVLVYNDGIATYYFAVGQNTNY